MPHPLLRAVLLAAGALLIATVPVAPLALGDDLPLAAGRVLGVAGRQSAWIDLGAPRPRFLTSFPAPAYATDVAALPGATSAAVAVTGSLNRPGPTGSDVLALDLSTGATNPLVPRADGRESIGAPAWWPDGSALLVERGDLTRPAVARAGQATVHYPARIERANADGSGRTILVQDGRQPVVAPNGSQVAFVRDAGQGTALLVQSQADGSEQTLVPPTLFADVGYPRYAPAGDRLAFMAPGQTVFGRTPLDWFGAGTRMALAHGTPWDLWVVGVDGTGLRQLAALGADDGSVTWSPDGTQLFVYGGGGSFVVDAATGAVAPLPYVSGYGATVWLPE